MKITIRTLRSIIRESLLEAPRAIKYHDGDRVRLLANPTEGWDEELATVDGEEQDGTYAVTVDEPGEGDDGMREVTPDQMELVSRAGALRDRAKMPRRPVPDREYDPSLVAAASRGMSALSKVDFNDLPLTPRTRPLYVKALEACEAYLKLNPREASWKRWAAAARAKLGS
jgi:hypothetical protein